jgi:DNA-binding beta-propeller fold protein YncE
VVDIDQRKVMRMITGMKGPQGIAHEASTDALYVANGGDGTVRIFQAAVFASLGRTELGNDADNIRVDADAKQIFIGYGSGALAAIDPASRNKIADIALSAHPESFQLDKVTPATFINVPDKQAVLGGIAAPDARSPQPTGNRTHFAMASSTMMPDAF